MPSPSKRKQQSPSSPPKRPRSDLPDSVTTSMVVPPAGSPRQPPRRAVAGAGAPAASELEGSLVLADGFVARGFSFGADAPMSGEVVFNTGMVGYPEALTDPSYRGQILVLTYPLIGNYGVPDEEEMDEFGLPKHFESSEIHIKGLIVADYSHEHSHWNAKKALGKWLKDAGIPALYGIDTRMLAKRLRTRGTVLGHIEFDGMAVPEMEDPNKRNLVAEVSIKAPRTFVAPGATGPTILAFDCGMKYNIIRCFLRHGCTFVVVPYNYDVKTNPDAIAYDAVFVSNGPGNPEMANATVESLRWLMALETPKPIFGICLGNQLLALAAGAKTYKMKFGNRSCNQPCIDMRTSRCYITPQNHGFAVDPESLSAEWRTFFLNANDMSNEGIVHTSKPFMAVQFHPEASAGPTDTGFLFEMFLEQVRGQANTIACLDMRRFERKTYRKVIVVGSGGLSIGQAGEFDYSGSQALKALKEEGIYTILINPNIATVQTSAGLASKVYFLPVTHECVLDIIKKEQPDGIIVSMGGQTALNVGVELFNAGDLERHNVTVLGTQIPTIVGTEDREAFALTLAEIDEHCALSYPATTIDMAVEAANKIGYPVLVRVAFTLGGLGSGFANNEPELRELAEKAFASGGQILLDQDLRGWKEVEYEVVRDRFDNCVTICNMENFDPLGVHTGDSIVVCPSQTLSNREYYMLRQASIKIVRHLGIVGECNVQFALHPFSERYCIIEVNARLSRSSALASKATGYPIAYVATKLSMGVDLADVRNSVTRTTTACFEPALDYCVVKMPRWDLAKFEHVDQHIGSAMKSVGEVMAIGRTFEETFQKATRMVKPGRMGFTPQGPIDTLQSRAELEVLLAEPSPARAQALADAFAIGMTVKEIHDLTKIDNWFLSKLSNINELRLKTEKLAVEAAASSTSWQDALTGADMAVLKKSGMGDKQIATYLAAVGGDAPDELAIRAHRISLGVMPYVKQIDTLAAEFPAQTNYLYVTYSGSEHDVTFAHSGANGGVIVLGCGAYCIGSSVEFDWCAVSCVRAVRDAGKKAIVINYNPETVSTDYDECDRLYFEELSLERVLDIYQLESAEGVVVSVGGQIPNNLAMPLIENGANVFGTAPESIDRCEDRNRFSAMLDDLHINQPAWTEVTSLEEARLFCDRVEFPVIVRPSYVLSGAAMKVVPGPEQLKAVLMNAGEVSGDHPVVVSKFIVNAKEIEFDGVANQGRMLNYAISEHVENAGVHSGDATLVLPAQKLWVETQRRVKKIAIAIAEELMITGPFNMQFMAVDNNVLVIECNLRSSRTFPFISKTFNFNFIRQATQAMMGLSPKIHPINVNDMDFVAVKAPQFSFTRLAGADPTLGVEMSSTGEVACFGPDIETAFLTAILAAGFKMPGKAGRGKNVLLSIGTILGKRQCLGAANRLQEFGCTLFCTPGTKKFLEQAGVSNCDSIAAAASASLLFLRMFNFNSSNELTSLSSPLLPISLSSSRVSWRSTSHRRGSCRTRRH